MTILTSGYVDNAISTASRTALAPDTSAFVQYEAQAVAVVQAKAAVAGYSVGASSTNAMVKRLVLGQWYVHALGFRKGMKLPPLVAEAINDLRLVSKGDLPIPGMTASASEGVSGVKFSATTGSSARSQFFSRSNLKDFS